jgi:2-oxo-4-hydroxy-4-carboxy-5-ureidoimidazoline decarboxylase
MSDPTTLNALNAATPAAFVTALAGIFEHASWVPEAAVGARPFASSESLLAAMVAVVLAAPQPQKLALIRAHPDLAGRLAAADELTEASSAEQADAGLDQCSPEELKRFETLNDAYKSKFGFPFVMAVKGRSRADILAAFEQRLEHDEAEEFDAALEQIAKIARLRLTALVRT